MWPHWITGANYGAGEPRFVFYPPVSWVLGGMLGGLLPWTAVPQALTFLAFAGAGISFYRLARVWVATPVAAGAACVYLANPYLLFVAYERTAYGELLAAVAMPLVVLYTLRRSGRPLMTPLAVVIAALWLTNAPAAVMGCYVLGLCSLAASGARRSLVPLGKALAGLALGTAAAAVYVLPAWYEQRWVEIERAVGSGMRVEDSFLFGHTGEAFHDQVLHTASWISVAVIGVGLAAILVQLVLRRKGPADGVGVDRRSLLWTLAAMLLAIALLLLRWSDPVWRFAPELHFLQFPWRWLLVGGMAATLALAVLVDGGWRAIDPGRSMGVVVALALVLCGGAWLGGHYAERVFAQPCDDEDNVGAQLTLLAGTRGFEGTDEYTTAGADNGEIQQELPQVRLLREPADDEGDDSVAPNPKRKPGTPQMGKVEIAEWDPEHKRLSVTTPRPSYAVLRLMDYPAWQVRVNGRLAAQRARREDGLLTIPVAAGTTRIEVSYGTTRDVYAGRAISLVSICVLIFTGMRERRAPAGRRQSGLSYDET